MTATGWFDEVRVICNTHNMTNESNIKLIIQWNDKNISNTVFSLQISTFIARLHAHTDMYNGMPLIIHGRWMTAAAQWIYSLSLVTLTLECNADPERKILQATVGAVVQIPQMRKLTKHSLIRLAWKNLSWTQDVSHLSPGCCRKVNNRGDISSAVFPQWQWCLLELKSLSGRLGRVRRGHSNRNYLTEIAHCWRWRKMEQPPGKCSDDNRNSLKCESQGGHKIGM